MERVRNTLVVCIAQCVFSVAGANSPLTIEDAIQTTRLMTDRNMNPVFVSPDGQRYALMAIRGDIARDGVWAEILTGQLTSLDLAEPHVAARFFTRGLGNPEGFGQLNGSSGLTQPWANIPKWIDNRRIALLWEDDAGVIRPMLVDVVTGDVRRLANGTTNVSAFGISVKGDLLLDVRVSVSRARSEQMLHDGFVVTSPEAMPLLAGIVDGTSVHDPGWCDRVVVTQEHPSPRSIGINGQIPCQLSMLASQPASQIVFSPDGKWAIVNSTVSQVPSDWRQYTQRELLSLLAQRAAAPKDLNARAVQHLLVVDVENASARPLWNAPFNWVAPSNGFAWSPDSRSVVLWPTFLPVERADASGLEGISVAEVEIATGRFRSIPIPANVHTGVTRIIWESPTRIAAYLDDGRDLHFQKIRSLWRAADYCSGQEIRPRNMAPSAMVRIEVREDMNTAPAVYAIEAATSRERLVLDLNPQLRDRPGLGRVELVQWIAPEGREWEGRLYYPAEFREGRRYPLVIQTHGYARQDEYSVYGPGGAAVALGPGWSVYLAQPLAGRGIAVLQVGAPLHGLDSVDDSTTLKMLAAGFASGAEALISAGMVDPHRVGLMGHSATGRVVEYAIAQSGFRYAAAIVADAADTNYLLSALYGWPPYASDLNGAAPFGDGLRSWFQHSPAFNTERIHTPLQLQVTSSSEGFGTLLWGWEMFSRLRYLKKPVEYYVVPDIRHGSHLLQNPRQLRALQNRALDWWCFWLKSEEVSAIGKQEQYASWHKLRKLHSADVRRNDSPRAQSYGFVKRPFGSRRRSQ